MWMPSMCLSYGTEPHPNTLLLLSSFSLFHQTHVCVWLGLCLTARRSLTLWS
jgi:hypothetical protein